jgi:hypothetical protein
MSTKKGKMAVAFLGVLVAGTSLEAAATALTGVYVSDTGLLAYPGESCGWQFTPTTSIQITKLGYWAGRTSYLNYPVTVTIYDSAGNAKISGTVPAGDVSSIKEGVYAYIDVSSQSVVLSAGQTYTIASYWTRPEYSYLWDDDVQYTSIYSVGSSLITLGKVELISPGQTMPTDPDPRYNSTNTFLSPNFQFEPPMPTANAGGDVSIYTSQQGSTVLDGSGADRAGGTNVTYRWLKDGTALQDWAPVGADGAAPFALSTLEPPLGIGTYTLTLEVQEGSDTVSDTMVLSIFNTPPEAVADPASQVKNDTDAVTVSATVADFDGDQLSYEWREGAMVLESGLANPPAGGAPVGIPALAFAPGALRPGAAPNPACGFRWCKRLGHRGSGNSDRGYDRADFGAHRQYQHAVASGRETSGGDDLGARRGQQRWFGHPGRRCDER